MLNGRLVPAASEHFICSLHSLSSRSFAAMAAAKRVLVPIGTGSEEMEAVITIDVLRRAGADVVVGSVEDSLTVTCARQARAVGVACSWILVLVLRISHGCGCSLRRLLVTPSANSCCT